MKKKQNRPRFRVLKNGIDIGFISNDEYLSIVLGNWRFYLDLLINMVEDFFRFLPSIVIAVLLSSAICMPELYVELFELVQSNGISSFTIKKLASTLLVLCMSISALITVCIARPYTDCFSRSRKFFLKEACRRFGIADESEIELIKISR
jgi:hypothetical protein